MRSVVGLNSKGVLSYVSFGGWNFAILLLKHTDEIILHCYGPFWPPFLQNPGGPISKTPCAECHAITIDDAAKAA
jgi:hypothetical protein